MPDLTSVEGVFVYLDGTRFAATDVQLLTGGHSGFTYCAKLQTPLPTGETSIVLKHSEGYLAAYQPMEIEAERAVRVMFMRFLAESDPHVSQVYEYEALVAVSASGLFDSDSVVQVPKPVHFDSETNTIFMTDLGAVDTLTKVLTDSLQGVHDGDNTESKLKAACSLASAAGSALGDFVGRFHNWSSSPEQAALCKRFAHNVAGAKQILSVHHHMTIRSATMFGMMEPWLADIIEQERQDALSFDGGLAIGDFSLDNVLVSQASEHGGLRLYIIDWEMAKPSPPEFDVGEITGAATSFARRYGVRDVYPFVPALHRAYSRHRTLDPLKIARLAGMDTMGLATILTWARGESEEFLKQVTLEGYELMRLSKTSDINTIKTKSLVKNLFPTEAQQMI
ncbi:hypothetical protein FRC07_014319 [Ceratobasidium sp. 392]|nr:hypothetical protein FRC07_014319 [Ceratobasidium sp. 392]